MKLTENGITLTKRDLLTRCNQLEKALGTQAQRADAAEREADRLRGECIRRSVIIAFLDPAVFHRL